MPSSSLPTFNFGIGNIFQSLNLSVVFIVICAIAIIIGLILVYHWHNYGVGPKRAWLAEIAYFSGLAILIAIGLSIISLIPIS